jgi:hypothetical protein
VSIAHGVTTTHLVVDEPSRVVEDDTLAISARVRIRADGAPRPTPVVGDTQRLIVRVHDVGQFDPDALAALRVADPEDLTPLLPVLALMASRLDADLAIDAATCPVATSGVVAATAQYAAWWGWHGVGVQVRRDAAPQPASGGRGLFFTRGLDSASVLVAASTAGHPPTHLVGLDWVDAPYDIADHGDVWRATAAAAAESGLPLVRVTTNARTFTDPLISWDFSHAPVLAATALALGGVVDCVGIASTHPAGHPVPFASHPDVDPLWSSATVRIEHRLDVPGGRTARAGVVAGDPWAARWLAVCWEQSGEGNCGRCRKCLATMCSLWLVGADEVIANRFAGSLSPSAIESLAESVPLGGRGITASVARELAAVGDGDTLDGLSVRTSVTERRMARALGEAWRVVLDGTAAGR